MSTSAAGPSKCVCTCSYECLSKWTKILTFGIASAIAAVGITKFINVLGVISVFEYILNAYMMY